MALSKHISLVAPSRWIDPDLCGEVETLCQAAGWQVEMAPQVTERDGQLAGPDAVRGEALNAALAGEAGLIWAARGGYGAMRVLNFVESCSIPKLFMGYSDACALQLGALGPHVRCIHGPMPIDLAMGRGEVVAPALAYADELLEAGKVEPQTHMLRSIKTGAGVGKVMVMNLAVLCAMLGTRFEPEFDDTLLILEDVGEYHYALDRLFWRLSQSRLAPKLTGLVLGTFSDLEDNEVPWGETPEQMAARHFAGLPIASGMPVGHTAANIAVLQGQIGALNVTDSAAELILSGQLSA